MPPFLPHGQNRRASWPAPREPSPQEPPALTQGGGREAKAAAGPSKRRRRRGSRVCQLRAAPVAWIHAAASAMFLGRRACPAAALGASLRLRVLLSQPTDKGAEGAGGSGSPTAAATILLTLARALA